MKTLQRARRRLGRQAQPAPVVAALALGTPATTGRPADGTVALALTRPEMDAFAAALAARLGGAMPRPDSPARVAAALARALELAGGHGRPHVVRNPAGLYTPEYWHIRIEHADRPARAELELLAGGRRIDR